MCRFSSNGCIYLSKGACKLSYASNVAEVCSRACAWTLPSTGARLRFICCWCLCERLHSAKVRSMWLMTRATWYSRSAQERQRMSLWYLESASVCRCPANTAINKLEYSIVILKTTTWHADYVCRVCFNTYNSIVMMFCRRRKPRSTYSNPTHGFEFINVHVTLRAYVCATCLAFLSTINFPFYYNRNFPSYEVCCMFLHAGYGKN